MSFDKVLTLQLKKGSPIIAYFLFLKNAELFFRRKREEIDIKTEDVDVN